MKFQKIFIFLISVTIYWSCGSNPAQEGEKAYLDGNYNIAIKHFLEARQQNPENQDYVEKIALSYMLRGKELFDMRKNIKAFSGNFEKASEFLPENPSEKFKQKYSDILYELSSAYLQTKPNNDIEKEEFLNKSIEYLEEALFQNPQNSAAAKYLDEIKTENFQKMLDKGNDFYNKAEKGKNYDLYFSAEYYFKKASYFDIHNQEAKKKLSKSREKTISVLNFREDLAMAVADYTYQSGNFILDLTLKNFMREPVKIELDNFELTDDQGNNYQVNKKMMTEKFGAKSLKNAEVGELKTLDGIIVFSVPKKMDLDYIGYRMANGQIAKKYLP